MKAIKRKTKAIKRKTEENRKSVSSLEEMIPIISEKRGNYKIKFDASITDISFGNFFCRKPIRF